MYPIWHPYTQHKTSPEPLEVLRAKDASIFLKDGRELIDVVSSWWVNSYGHCNAYIAEKIYRQVLNMDQVIFAGFTHQPAIELSERILKMLPPEQQKIFFSDDGSTAVEVALKMCIQYFHNKGIRKKRIVAFGGAYHGDTFGAMAAGARGKFFEPFEDLIFKVEHIPPPVEGRERECIAEMERLLQSGDICCFIFEPLVQGAAGMVMHDAAALDKLIALCQQHGVLTIADEVMTGFGRTGRNFAIDYLSHKPDVICLSKCLTGGMLPMSLTTCTIEVFNAFCDDDPPKTFFHGHSYTGNPMGCAAALAGLDLLPQFEGDIRRISEAHRSFAASLADHPGLSRVQHLGTILSLELRSLNGAGYFSAERDRVYNYFLEHDILMRPLGNVIYLLPPYCITDEQLGQVYRVIEGYLGYREGLIFF